MLRNLAHISYIYTYFRHLKRPTCCQSKYWLCSATSASTNVEFLSCASNTERTAASWKLNCTFPWKCVSILYWQTWNAFAAAEDKVWTTVMNNLPAKTTVIGSSKEKRTVLQVNYSASMDQVKLKETLPFALCFTAVKLAEISRKLPRLKCFLIAFQKSTCH